MKAYRRHFIGLLIASLCCLLIGCGPHRTTDAEANAIKGNLQRVYTAGNQFMLENGKLEASYANLISPFNYLASMKPVNHEDYSGLVVKISTTSLSVKAADGREVVWTASR